MSAWLRWRYSALRALAGACLLIGALSAPAGAALALAGGTDVVFDGDAHSFHTAQQTVWSNSTYQFVGSWDARDRTTGEVYLQISRRRLSDDRIDTLRFDGTGSSPFAAVMRVPFDGHNGVGLGVSPNDGRIHVSYSMHTSDRRDYYVYSDDGCISEATFSFANCTFTRQFYKTSATAQYTEDVNRGRRGTRLDEEMTYPNYFNDSRGRLYFSYRHDASSRGVAVLHKYDDSTHTWSYVGDIVNGEDGDYVFDPDGGGPGGSYTGRTRGVYAAWGFDKNDRLHMMWAYRENGAGYAGQHGINYIYSDDYGVTWRSQAGRQLLDTSSRTYDPITISDLADTQVIAEPPGYMIGQPFFALDSNNNPHAVMAVSEVQTDDLGQAVMRQAHYWRLTDGVWHARFVEPASAGADEATREGRAVLDRADNLYVIYAHTFTGWNSWVSNIYRQTELPFENVTWQPDGSGGGYLDVQVQSDETYLWSDDATLDIPISTSGTNQVRVRMRNDTDNEDFTITWANDAGPLSVARQQTFVRGVRRRTGWTDYTFTITDADWSGTLALLELQPVSSSFTSGSVTFDWIRLTDSSGRVVRGWEFDQGRVLYGAEASQASNWGTWTVEPLLSEETFPFDEGLWWFDKARYDNAQVISFPRLAQGGPLNERLAVREYTITGDTVIKDWRFDADAMGWADSGGQTSSFRYANDSGTRGIGATVTGTDPRIVSATNLKVPTGSNRYVHVVLKNTTAARRAALYFITDADRTFDETKKVEFAITANSGYAEYDVDISAATGWSSQTLYQLRLDPVQDGSTRTGSFKVDRIYIDNTR